MFGNTCFVGKRFERNFFSGWICKFIDRLHGVGWRVSGVDLFNKYCSSYAVERVPTRSRSGYSSTSRIG